MGSPAGVGLAKAADVSVAAGHALLPQPHSASHLHPHKPRLSPPLKEQSPVSHSLPGGETMLMKILIRLKRSVPRIHALGGPTSKLHGATPDIFFERRAPHLLLCISKASYTFHRRMNSCQLGGVSNILIRSKVFLYALFSNQYLSFFLNLKTHPQYLMHREFLHLLLPHGRRRCGTVGYSPQWPHCSCAWHGPPASHSTAERHLPHRKTCSQALVLGGPVSFSSSCQSHRIR